MNRIIKIVSVIVLFVLLVSTAVFSQDLNQELLQAAKQGDTVRVKSLLANGADINAKNESGWTSLMFAALGGQTEVVNVLLANGLMLMQKMDTVGQLRY